MNQWKLLSAALLCLLLLSACHQKAADGVALAGPPQVGAIYSLSDGEGGFRAAKVLGVEGDVVFVQLFGERWSERPSLAAVRKKTSKSVPVAYSPQTFSGMQPFHLENGAVSAEETESYETWKTTKREVF